MRDFFVARQPIYRPNLEVFGYELLFRDKDCSSAEIEDQELASFQVIVNTFINIGLENIVGSSTAFINLPASFLTERDRLPMHTEQVVLELERAHSTPALLEAITARRREGYMVAVGLDHEGPIDPELVAAVDIVKVDTRDRGDALGAVADFLRRVNPSVMLLAEKVESEAVLEQARDAGFDLFQGFFFVKPNVVHRRGVPTNKQVALSLLQRLQTSGWTLDDIEALIVQDPGLSYKLMRYVNGATLAVRREIDSIRDALEILGAEAIKDWASMLLMADLNEDKSHELTRSALVRGKMLEFLGDRLDLGPERHRLFTLGLMSAMDVLMDVPTEQLLDTTSLTMEMRLALLENEGELGELLRQVLLYEQGCFSEMDTSRLGVADYRDAYLRAVRWTDAAMAAIPAEQSGVSDAQG